MHSYLRINKIDDFLIVAAASQTKDSAEDLTQTLHVQVMVKTRANDLAVEDFLGFYRQEEAKIMNSIDLFIITFVLSEIVRQYLLGQHIYTTRQLRS